MEYTTDKITIQQVDNFYDTIDIEELLENTKPALCPKSNPSQSVFTPATVEDNFYEELSQREYRSVLCAVADDYFNNYLTVELFAEHNGLTPTQADALLTLARIVRDSEHPDA